MKAGRFQVNGSPLDGLRVPQDWRAMDATGKRKALVDYGYATDFRHACRLMGQHAAAVMRRRREHREQARNRRHPEGEE
ncbi:MAG TPA: hypothetical protein PLA50_01960 [Bacteroidia bacterium]|nr:hypothetical protein [Bacteroidia bacterium]